MSSFLAETRDRLDYCGTVGSLGYIANKAAVNFYGVEGKAAKVTERRKSSAEIVERDTHALASKPVEGRDRARIVTKEYRLGDFQLESVWGNARETEGGLHGFVEIPAEKLRRRKIDSHPDCLGPSRCIHAGLTQRPVANGDYKARLFGKGNEITRRYDAMLRMVPAHQCFT